MILNRSMLNSSALNSNTSPLKLTKNFEGDVIIGLAAGIQASRIVYLVGTAASQTITAICDGRLERIIGSNGPAANVVLSLSLDAIKKRTASGTSIISMSTSVDGLRSRNGNGYASVLLGVSCGARCTRVMNGLMMLEFPSTSLHCVGSRFFSGAGYIDTSLFVNTSITKHFLCTANSYVLATLSGQKVSHMNGFAISSIYTNISMAVNRRGAGESIIEALAFFASVINLDREDIDSDVLVKPLIERHLTKDSIGRIFIAPTIDRKIYATSNIRTLTTSR